ncbi:hypothetical protein [Fluviicola sp.]|uniref:hypothetical protein n=1 Tax=Fluviicola sp. TaxID=1917219 RepID=UPI0031D7313D
MIPLLRKVVCTLLIGAGSFQSLYAQNDSIVSTINTKELNVFYVIERVYGDPRNPDKRPVVGAANFFQIEDGMLSISASSPRMTFLFLGKIDSVETDVVDYIPVMRVYATNNYDNVTIYPYIFEISQQDTDKVLIYARRKRTTSRYYFEAHVASLEEIAAIRKSVSKTR